MRLMLVLALTFGACVPAARVGSTARPWYETRTAHFVMTTSLGREEAEQQARRLEATWWTLARVYQIVVPGRPPPSEPMALIHFDDCAVFGELLPVGGILTNSADFRDRLVIQTCGPVGSGPAPQSMAHELAHGFNRHYLGSLPRWLNEGLADYYSTVALEKDAVVLGGLLARDALYWGRPGPRLDTGDLDGSFARIARTEGVWAAYFTARNLVHLLNGGSADYRERFQRYLALGAGGTPWRDAWTLAFGDLPPGRLDQEVRTYPLREQLRLIAAPYRPPPVLPAPDVRRLSVAEVHAVWAQVLMIAGKGPWEVLGHIEAAEKEDPTWGDGLYWRAVAQARYPKELGGNEDFARLLRRHLDRFPGDGRARMGLFVAQVSRLVPSDYTGLDPRPLPGVDAIREDAIALEQVARSARELNTVGWYYAVSRRPEVGLRFAERSVKLDPACGDCLDTLALLYHELGRDMEALATQRQAVLLLADRDVGAGPQARLDAYARAASAADPP